MRKHTQGTGFASWCVMRVITVVRHAPLCLCALTMLLVQPVPFFECDPESLEFVYTSPTPYIKDGLLFYHKQGTKQVSLPHA